MRNYSEGALVQLKSGGPTMSVTNCCYLGDCSQWGCTVMWFNSRNEMQTAALPEVCLVRAEENKEQPFKVGDVVFNTQTKVTGIVAEVYSSIVIVNIADEGVYLQTWKIENVTASSRTF